MNERETFGQHTHGKLVDFPRPLAATCRLFYHEMAGLPYSLSYSEQLRLETEREEWIPKVEVVRILTRKTDCMEATVAISLASDATTHSQSQASPLLRALGA